MSIERSPLLSGLSGKLFGSAAALGGLLVLMFLFLVRPDDPRTNRKGDEPVVADKSSAEHRCERELVRILDGMQPGRLGITSDRVAMTDELNRWTLNCKLGPDEGEVSSDGPLLAKLLSSDLLARANSGRFLPEDASHIRECLLARAIVEYATRDATTDVARVTGLFDFVVQHITLLPSEAGKEMPLSPYESLLFGIGTAEDRAWTFATLLRQIRIDGVLLEPQREGGTEHWLVGVILDREGVLLFDPRLGLMIPAMHADNEGTPFPTRPATLADVLSDDAPFRQLDLPDSAYALRSADMTDLKVRLIGSSSLWAGRMAELQFMLPQEVSVDIYDGLGENSLRQPGMWDRVAAAGTGELWTEEDMGIWEFPERQLALIDAARGAEGTALAGLFRVFRGPYVPRQDPRTGEVYSGTTERTLHAVRIEQLTGDHVEALRHYLPIRTSAQTTPLAENLIAADYAAIWTAISQYETGKQRVALETLERYAARHGDGSGFARSAVEWGSRCHLSAGAYADAARMLATVPASPAPRRDLWLINRWLKLSGGDGPRSENPESVPPATSPSTDEPRSGAEERPGN